MNKPNIVVSQTPYRLCIGGGTDLIPYVKRHEGHAFSTAIDKYSTIMAQKEAPTYLIRIEEQGSKIIFSK